MRIGEMRSGIFRLILEGAKRIALAVVLAAAIVVALA